MFEVTFWRDGVEYRECGKYWYDEALILDTEDYSTTFVTRNGVSGTF